MGPKSKPARLPMKLLLLSLLGMAMAGAPPPAVFDDRRKQEGWEPMAESAGSYASGIVFALIELAVGLILLPVIGVFVLTAQQNSTLATFAGVSPLVGLIPFIVGAAITVHAVRRLLGAGSKK